MKVIAICSGGVDSISMASRYKGEDLTLMSFDYGQKGVKEVGVVQEFAKLMGADFKLIDISFMKRLFGANNQLTGDTVAVEGGYTPSVVVPLRNAVFTQIAMVYAYSNEADIVTLGSHADDQAEVNGERLYPDCSYEFFKAFELAMDFGTFKKQKKVKIQTPSTLGIHKSELIKIGHDNLGEDIFKTWSCYKSGEKQCGQCESCNNRKAAFAKAGIEDKTVYEIK